MKNKSSNWRTLLNRWISGESNRSDERSLEAMAKDDPFLADALEGFRSTPESDHARSVTKLKANLRNRYEKKRRGTIFYIQRIAAIGLLVIAAWFISGQFGEEEKAAEIAEIKTNSQKDDSPAASTSQISDNLESIAQVENETKEEYANQDLTAKKITPAPKATEPRLSPSPPSAAMKPAPAIVEDIAADILPDKPIFIDGVPIRKDSTFLMDEGLGYIAAEPERAEEEAPAMPTPEYDDFGFEEPEEARQRVGNMAIVGKVIEGKITDSDGFPLIGANVQLENMQEGTITNFDGLFKIESPIENPSLTISYTGYQTQQLRASGNDFLQIQLQESDQQLSEVAVTALSGAAKKSKEHAVTFEPQGGFKKFEKYVRQNIRQPQEAADSDVTGLVIVGFKLDSTGKPIDLEILQPLGIGYDEEAIRLLQSGPKWEGPTGIQTSYAIEFK